MSFRVGIYGVSEIYRNDDQKTGTTGTLNFNTMVKVVNSVYHTSLEVYTSKKISNVQKVRHKCFDSRAN